MKVYIRTTGMGQGMIVSVHKRLEKAQATVEGAAWCQVEPGVWSNCNLATQRAFIEEYEVH